MITRPNFLKGTGKVIMALLVGILALSQAGMAAGGSQVSDPPPEEPTYQVMIPNLYSHGYTSETLKGFVFDPDGQPVARATVVTNDGLITYTDENGEYVFMNISKGSYVVSASKYGYQFFPERRTVEVVDFADQENFDANQVAACYEDIANSDFEVIGGWVIPITVYSAGYSQARAHSGVQSMRTGIVDSTLNRFSYSDFRQVVTIPYNATSATLRFWVYPSSTEPTPLTAAKPQVGMNISEVNLSTDVQYLLILDPYYNILETMFWQRENTQIWTLVERNLMAYAGRTIYLQYGTFNNGLGGITSMYVDDVSVEICDFATVQNTIAGKVTDSNGLAVTGVTLSTNTGRVTSTDSAGNYSFSGLAAGTYTVTPSKPGFSFTPSSITATVPPDQLGRNFTANLTAACYQEFANSGMEDSSGWIIPVTRYTAGYTNSWAHAGTRSMRTGIVDLAANTYSYSDFRQTAIIPVNATRVTLDYWRYPVSSEPTTAAAMSAKPELFAFFEDIVATMVGDSQYLLILNQYNQIVEWIMSGRSNTQVWENWVVDLTKYRGWIIKTQYGTYNDGASGITTMYVDDVYMEICVP